MISSKKNIMITGIPGIGKTTLIKKILDQQKHWKVAGFYTEEIRERGIRKGFDLVDLSGRRNVLSHVRIKSLFRVGKYGVDIKGFEKFLDGIDFFDSQTDLVVIDEIGKMECYSNKFRSLIQKLLDSDIAVIATIARKGAGFIAEIKKRSDIQVFELTEANRDEIIFKIIRAIS